MKRNFFSAIILPLFAIAALCAFPSRASALMMADFEVASGYASGNLLYGQQGWSGCASNTSRVTPDPINTGQTFAISGDQSAVMTGYSTMVPFLSFASANATAGDMGSLTWLQALPGTQTAGTGGYSGIWIYKESSGSTPMGLFIYNGGNVIMEVNGVIYDSGEKATMGGGGVPTLNKVYRFTMEFNWDEHEVTGYMADADGSNSINLGTYTWNSGVLDTASDAVNPSNGWGVAMWTHTSGGYGAFDDIELIPEPTVVGLAGFSLAGLLLRRRRRRKV